MQTCQEYTNDIAVLSAALLHDVFEDTTATRETMRQFLDEVLGPQEAVKTLRLVEELTDIFTRKNYPALNRRARKNREIERLAEASRDVQTIKYADLIDNSTNIANHDPDFGAVFLGEGRALLKKLDKGDQALYARAIKIVAESQRTLTHKKRPATASADNSSE